MLFAQFVAWSRLAPTMMREVFSVSPGGSDDGADLSQFCDSRGRGSARLSTCSYHTVIASEAKQSRLSPRKDSGLLRFAHNDGNRKLSGSARTASASDAAWRG
ncbi:hypothetical protein EAS61_29965 [Bradyrhizobium zhanjiangense]|uniref:Uncharacterized protein n=1 Tax=Bradyrhizobium zhanjiangense TaxID=1325107 RepID=A0A4Q0QD17_9BRAD|nr:hypothetical protein EAS61_29965 [Bradyrhizobium zhanjiangense]